MTVRAEEQITLSRVNDGDNGVKVYDGTAGSVVTVSNASEYPALELVADIEPIQPNDYDSVWVGGAGKNKLVYPYNASTHTVNGVTFTVNNDGSVKINGTCTATGTYLWLYGSSATPLMPTLEQGKTYTLSIEGAIGGINGQCIFYGSPSVVNTAYGSGDKYVTFTVPDMSGYNGNGIVIAVINGYTFNNVTVKPMIRLATVSDATWQPYENICPIYGHDHCDVVVSPTLLDTDGTTYTTNFPQVVYGGTLDVVSGKLVLTKAKKTFDGTENWQKSSSKPASFFTYWSQFSTGAGKPYQPFICSHAKMTDSFASYTLGECYSDSSCSLYIQEDTNMTIAGFKSFLADKYNSGNPVEVCYELATPQTYQLTPQEIELLTGTNNVWATTGDITDFKYAEISNDTLTVLDKVSTDIKKTSQYFWHEQTGTEAGAHITEIPQEEFEANPSGGNLLATSNGIVVRDGLSDTAVYSADGIILYAPNNVLGFQIATTGGTSEQSVLRVRNIYYPSGTITDTIPQLSSIPTSTEIEWRWASTRMSLNRTLTFTRGTSATETISFTLTQTATVSYDGVATFTITNNSGIEDFKNVSIRYEYVTTTPEIKVKDAVLTDGTWYCESKVLLWENSNPSNDWSGDLTSSDIDLDTLALCDEVEIYYYFSKTDKYVYSQRCSVAHGGIGNGTRTNLSTTDVASNKNGGRSVTSVNDTTGITINSGFFNGSQNNSYSIPWKVIGIRHI